jgi:hypothetical protein
MKRWAKRHGRNFRLKIISVKRGQIRYKALIINTFLPGLPEPPTLLQAPRDALQAQRRDVTLKTSVLLLAAFAMLPLGAARAQSGDLRTELMHCLAFTGAVERLSCYDRLARGAASGGLATPMPPPGPRASIQPPPAAPPSLGQEELPGRPPTPMPDRVAAEITNFQKDSTGRFTVILGNGQVWQQVAGDTTAAQYQPGRTRSVTISRGSFGSYDLKFNDRNAAFKVRRVR